MLTLYPEIKPNARHRIAVDAPHELYVEESGNPDGIPVLVVHGGPGGGYLRQQQQGACSLRFGAR